MPDSVHIGSLLTVSSTNGVTLRISSPSRTTRSITNVPDLDQLICTAEPAWTCGSGQGLRCTTQMALRLKLRLEKGSEGERNTTQLTETHSGCHPWSLNGNSRSLASTGKRPNIQPTKQGPRLQASGSHVSGVDGEPGEAECKDLVIWKVRLCHLSEKNRRSLAALVKSLVDSRSEKSNGLILRLSHARLHPLRPHTLNTWK